MEMKAYWYWLCNLEQIGPKKIQELLDFFGTPQGVFSAKETELEKIKLLNKKNVTTLLNNRDLEKVQESYEKLKKKSIRFLTKEDVEYPQQLKHIYNSPVCIYVRGNLPDENKTSVAMVGARNCSDYGKEVALYFSRKLSEAGIQVISGLARGIDGYAHKGALDAGFLTYGVLGCGIDICYPSSHLDLYMAMEKQGGILSEYGLGIPPSKGNFPMRNRLISGLCDGILVIEAKEKSGSLITVDMGLEQGKDIFAIPGRIQDSLSDGCNNLIKMGAEIVTSPEDILKAYHMEAPKNQTALLKNPSSLDEKETLLLHCLTMNPKHISQIATETNLLITNVMSLLIHLELKGFIKQTSKNYFIKMLS